MDCAGGYFVFLTMRFILNGVMDSIGRMKGIISALDNRVQTMNHDIIRIDTLMSTAFGVKPDINPYRSRRWEERRKERLMDIASLIKDFGFPIVAAVGLGYFVYYVWNWATKQVDPTLEQANVTLIALIDRIRMLDNDLIRLNQKLTMILEHQEEKEKQDEIRKQK